MPEQPQKLNLSSQRVHLELVGAGRDLRSVRFADPDVVALVNGAVTAVPEPFTQLRRTLRAHEDGVHPGHIAVWTKVLDKQKTFSNRRKIQQSRSLALMKKVKHYEKDYQKTGYNKGIHVVYRFNTTNAIQRRG